MTASAEHVKALLRSHATGDDASFYSTALQVAARAAKQGHLRLAEDLKRQVDVARAQTGVAKVTSIATPRGDLAEIVTASHPDVALRDLVVRGDLSAELVRVLTEQRQRRVLSEHGFAASHRLLLEGPPGTGKTMTAAVLAHELSLPLMTVRLDSLLSKFLGETASKLRTVFNAAVSQRAVFFFDEFDALGADRAGNDVGEARRILNSFLILLEQSSGESLIVAATNHRSLLDRAVFRRFDAVLNYELPSTDEAVLVLRSRLGSLGKGVRWAEIATTATEGISHADLVRAAESAAKDALLRGETRINPTDLLRTLKARRVAGA